MQTYKENVGGQTNYNIYVPENVTEDTPVLFYSYNLEFTEKMKEDIMEQNGDAIIIVPENSPVMVGGETYGHQFQSEAIEVFNLVKEKYNLETTQFSQAGYSAAYGCSIRTMADYIKSNPDAERQILISVDGCESNTSQGFPIYKSEYAALQENNAIIISYSQKYRQNSEIRFLKDAGLPILFVVDPDIPENSYSRWSYYHDVVPNNFTDRGLYNSLMNFALGKGDLPEGYIYQVYNPQTGKVEDIEASEVASFFGINTYETLITRLSSLSNLSIENLSVTSDSGVLLTHINNIIGNIKNSNFVQNGINYNGSFTSTTKVPSSIPSIVKEFYSANATLLLKIANEVKEFAKIGESIDKIDKESKEEAIELENIINTTVSTSSTVVNTLSSKEETTIQETLVQVPTEKVSTLTNNEPKVETTETTKTTQEENDTEKNKQTEQKTENKGPEENKQTEEKNESKTETKEKDTYSSMQNNQSANNQPQKSETNNTTTNVTQNSSTNNSNNTYNQQETNPLDEFPEYKEVYSDETKIVYDYNNEYRIIVHKDGDEIIGIEHYYKFDNELVADKALETLSTKYANNENIENIIQKGSYVKVVFKEEMYENLTINEIRNQYKDLSEVIKL